MLSCGDTSILFRFILQYLYYYFLIILVLLFKVTEQSINIETEDPLCRVEAIKARHKSCFLRPDSGPCRADIVQWYFDVKQDKCYEFFWGGCQGNGNRFETQTECIGYCWFNSSIPIQTPYFCDLAFEYGNCFGHYERWSWDKYYKICKRRIYSGCAGNQNNFETVEQCRATCVNTRPPRCKTTTKYTTDGRISTRKRNQLRYPP